MASFGEMGIDFEEKAFYDILISLANKYDFTYPEDKLLDLAKEVKKIIDDKAKYTDWNKRDDIKAELHFDLIILLDEWGYPPIDRDEVIKRYLSRQRTLRRIDDEVYIIKENIRSLKKDFESIKLEYEYLSSAEKLLEFQNLYFDNELVKKDIQEIKKINISLSKLRLKQNELIND